MAYTLSQQLTYCENCGQWVTGWHDCKSQHGTGNAYTVCYPTLEEVQLLREIRDLLKTLIENAKP